eukprot:scaffold91847_cov33-Tisochrysis_lutea.AAC.2
MPPQGATFPSSFLERSTSVANSKFLGGRWPRRAGRFRFQTLTVECRVFDMVDRGRCVECLGA